MKKLFFFFLITGLSFLLAGNTNAQTRQENTALNQVEAEIRSLEHQSSALDTIKLSARIDQLNAKLGAMLPVEQAAAIRRQLSLYKLELDQNRLMLEKNSFRLEELYIQRQVLRNKPISAAIQDKTPKEIRSLEKKRRFNSLEVRSGEVQVSKEELSLQKLQETTVYTDGVNGYKVLIWNQDKRRPGNFKLTDMSGKDIDGASFYLAPGEKKITYLLPGEYLGTVQMYGRATGCVKVPVEIRQKEVFGEVCHGYLVQMPR